MVTGVCSSKDLTVYLVCHLDVREGVDHLGVPRG